MNWQPIETAEKDKRSRLVWCPENKCIFVAYWGMYYDWKDNPAMGWLVFGAHETQLAEEPTHWMELPEPPAAEKGSQ